MRVPTLDEHAVTDWRYVAEGGANLVVAYTGQQDPLLRNTVLRLRKVNHDYVKPADMTYLHEEDASVAFTDRVVIPLLEGGERAVANATPRLASLPVSREWLERMEEHIEPARPATRSVVDSIDVERSYVVLAENLVGIEGDDEISVEIKVGWRRTSISLARVLMRHSHARGCPAQMGLPAEPSAPLRRVSRYQDAALPLLPAPPVSRNEPVAQPGTRLLPARPVLWRRRTRQDRHSRTG